MKNTFSPKQVARALDVSESSLKRWCDRGLIGTVKTAGGHRRIALSDVVAFVQRSEQALIRPELLGLPPISRHSNDVLEKTADYFLNGLRKGDLETCRKLILESFVAGTALCELFDVVIAPAMHAVGDLWECENFDVYEERVACGICTRVIDECRNLVPGPAEDAPVAFGATPEGDPYAIATRMAECTALENGWLATSLGENVPFSSLSKAALDRKPRLIWISVSSVGDSATFLKQYDQFQSSLHPSIAVIVGGRALSLEIRREMRFTSYCDNFQQFANAARTLKASIQRPQADEPSR